MAFENNDKHTSKKVITVYSRHGQTAARGPCRTVKLLNPAHWICRNYTDRVNLFSHLIYTKFTQTIHLPPIKTVVKVYNSLRPACRKNCTSSNSHKEWPCSASAVAKIPDSKDNLLIPYPGLHIWMENLVRSTGRS